MKGAWGVLGIKDVQHIQGYCGWEWFRNVLFLEGEYVNSLYAYWMWTNWWARNDFIFTRHGTNVAMVAYQVVKTFLEFL